MTIRKSCRRAVALGCQAQTYLPCIYKTTAHPAARQTYGAARAVKNGSTYYGKDRLKCKRCGRQFVQMRTYEPLSNECKRRIELRLAEPISLEAICRVLEIKPHQLYAYMDELYDEIPADLACSVSEKSAIELIKVDCELDELWSFVGWNQAAGAGQ